MAANLRIDDALILICAVAVRNQCDVFTTNRDFQKFAQCLPVVLHSSTDR